MINGFPYWNPAGGFIPRQHYMMNPPGFRHPMPPQFFPGYFTPPNWPQLSLPECYPHPPPTPQGNSTTMAIPNPNGLCQGTLAMSPNSFMEHVQRQFLPGSNIPGNSPGSPTYIVELPNSSPHGGDSSRESHRDLRGFGHSKDPEIVHPLPDLPPWNLPYVINVSSIQPRELCDGSPNQSGADPNSEVTIIETIMEELPASENLSEEEPDQKRFGRKRKIQVSLPKTPIPTPPGDVEIPGDSSRKSKRLARKRMERGRGEPEERVINRRKMIHKGLICGRANCFCCS